MKEVFAVIGLLAGLAAPSFAANGQESFEQGLQGIRTTVLKTSQVERGEEREGASGISFGNSWLDENSSWEQILGSTQYLPKWPKVVIKNWHVPVSGFCVDGVQIRTNTKVEECRNWGPRRGGREQDTPCTETTNEYLTKPLEYQDTQCMQWACRGPKCDNPVCRRTEVVTHKTPLSYNVWVSGHNRPHFEKEFTIPSCK
jgi:hypothetical protein